jgi:hypothetical protein
MQIKMDIDRTEPLSIDDHLRPVAWALKTIQWNSASLEQVSAFG